MVVIFLPTAALTGNEHERTGAPSMCTVQAPHCAMPQPYFVPVRPTCSRIAHNRGVLSSTSTLKVLPLMDSRAIGVFPPLGANDDTRVSPESQLPYRAKRGRKARRCPCCA